jgi:phosphoglycerol transferase MdoB-like AlkP superfamily enzyme
MKLITENFGLDNLGQSLTNGLGILLGILDIAFVLGLVASILLLGFNFVKYGLKQIKKNSDETSKETQIQ